MKQINGYWVDSNCNRWDCNSFSKKEAKVFSKTLFGCSNCTNCIKCINCVNCYRCDCCTNCSCCNRCSDCNNCNRCYLCDCCVDCYYCGSCTDCHYCDSCDNCYNCYHCDYFKENPQIYKTKRIGSRKSQTIFYYGKTDKGMEVQVVCGCFKGNLEEFKNAVLETHKHNDKYREQYLKEIAKVKLLFDLN